MKKRLLPEIDKNLLQRVRNEFLGIPPEEKDPMERLNDPVRQRNVSQVYGENLKTVFNYIKESDVDLAEVIEKMAEGASDPGRYRAACAILYYIFASATEEYLEKKLWESGMLKPGEMAH